MAEGALKDRSGYCRKEHKKTQKTGKDGNEPGQSQDGFPFLGSFRFLRQTLFPLVAALIEGFMGFVRVSSRLGGLAAFPTSGPNTDRQTKQSREAAKPRRGDGCKKDDAKGRPDLERHVSCACFGT
jgi:hypothetical protein